MAQPIEILTSLEYRHDGPFGWRVYNRINGNLLHKASPNEKILLDKYVTLCEENEKLREELKREKLLKEKQDEREV